MTILVFLLAAAAGVTRPEVPKLVARYAIVIGQNHSDDPTIPALRYADDDAIATYRMFTEAGIQTTLLVAMDEDSVRLNPDITPAGFPTRNSLFESFAKISGQMNMQRERGVPRVDFFLFYSGHGGVDNGEGHIVLQGGRLTRSDLHREMLDKSPASLNHVIIDACKSYYLAMPKGPGGLRRPYMQQFAAKPEEQANVSTGFILSSSSDRDSHEWERYQAGIFSHEVRSALRGGADIESDGRITYAEMGAFLATANQRVDNPRFRPDFYVSPPGGRAQDLGHEILSWPPGGAVLVIDRIGVGHLYLEDARGERVLDIHPGPEDIFVLRLPAERPLFLRKADESEEYQILKKEILRLANLSATSTSVVRKGAIHLAFENLFKEPFSPAKVSEYSKGAVTLKSLPVEVPVIEAPLQTGSIVRKSALWSAIGLGALGLGANLWALGVNRSVRNDTSHKEGMDMNDTIEGLNTTAWILYSLAGAAVITWLVATLADSDPGPDATFVVAPLASQSGAGAEVRFGFEW